MAYRRPKGILDAIGGTVEVQEVLRPIYNFKDDHPDRRG